jgi:hypothetical protein
MRADVRGGVPECGVAVAGCRRMGAPYVISPAFSIANRTPSGIAM